MAAPFTPTTVTQGFGAEVTNNTNNSDISDAFETVLNKDDATDNAMNVDLDMNGNDILNVNSLTMQLTSYTVATLPNVATFVRTLIWVSDETGGATPAFSDGTNWRRIYDYTIVS